MIDHEIELFDAHPEWRPLLAAYQDQIQAGKLAWSPRITHVDGTPDNQLSLIHGKLIALGMLKFEISSRADGVQYQLTPIGRQALLPPGSRQIVPDWQQSDEPEPAAA
jgi:hypothetical protein